MDARLKHDRTVGPVCVVKSALCRFVQELETRKLCAGIRGEREGV